MWLCCGGGILLCATRERVALLVCGAELAPDELRKSCFGGAFDMSRLLWCRS